MNKLENKKILIVGLGLIGASYAKGFIKQNLDVYGVDASSDVINYAKKEKIIKDGKTTEEMAEFLADMDIIVFALYPSIIVSWILDNQKYFKKGAILTDVTGVKEAILEKIEKNLRPDLSFIGAHPMAGLEKSGIMYANDEMFLNANYIITPTSNTKEEAIDIAKEIGKVLGFKNISILTASIHDEMIAFLSQLTHCIAISLMCAKESEHLVEYTGDSFRDLTRIASINENMWSELFLMNKDKLINEMNQFEEQFGALKQAIVNEDVTKIKEMMILSTKRRKYFNR